MERSGHSSLGIASFWSSACASFLLLTWIIIGALDGDENIVAIIMISQVFASIIGTGLGIFPLFSTSRKRGFAVAGVVIGVGSLVIALGVLGLGLWALNAGIVTVD